MSWQPLEGGAEPARGLFSSQPLQLCPEEQGGTLQRGSRSLELRPGSVLVPLDEEEPRGGAGEPFPVGQRVIHCHRTMS